MSDYLHHHSDFSSLLEIIASDMGIIPQLIEKDYWIMHVLYGLKKQGFEFQLKGGTSLSKGYKIIDRFSEDIDIRIMPPDGIQVATDPRKIKSSHVQSRKEFYDWLANEIRIDGIESIERDKTFDDERYYRSGGIRLNYKNSTNAIEGVKKGILLEVGFDTVTPNSPLVISSWAYDRALGTAGITIEDNRAKNILCYHPGYSLVEKLQTIATKFRQEMESGTVRQNLIRQYYDVYCLLGYEEVRKFIGTKEYLAHKEDRFPPTDFAIPISENEAFQLKDKNLREKFRDRYLRTSAVYYKGQPDFDELLDRIQKFQDQL
jgi:hypothetical protein